MKTTYDKLADAFYITFRKGKVANTVRLSDRMIVDLDKNGNTLGVEMLNASQQFDIDNVIKMPQIPVVVT